MNSLMHKTTSTTTNITITTTITNTDTKTTINTPPSPTIRLTPSPPFTLPPLTTEGTIGVKKILVVNVVDIVQICSVDRQLLHRVLGSNSKKVAISFMQGQIFGELATSSATMMNYRHFLANQEDSKCIHLNQLSTKEYCSLEDYTLKSVPSLISPIMLMMIPTSGGSWQEQRSMCTPWPK
ncbi:unnamed protein product [Nesidiocoris tenuis]|uniref:Uncharacterized protein n=1 Tax=Nesidiocoris tenuis TaxID=355587 RepID=A0A6H5GZ18_9HEMI|nr:unnamed protein product [Nesidiocoris tenuis]